MAGASKTEERKMSEKDLGEGLEAFENEVENLKNAKMKLFGITMTPTTIGALFALLSAIGGSLYAGFEFYKDYVDMREVVQNIDTTEIENRNKIIEQKLDDAIDYSRDIKDDLRDQINTLDDNVRRVEKLVRDTESDVRQIIQNAEERFDNKRDALQNQYDDKASDLRNTSDQRLTDLENKVERDMKELDQRLSDKLQRALNNPLAN
jgi:membrane-associated HD superfamily phosphohydrolase